MHFEGRPERGTPPDTKPGGFRRPTTLFMLNLPTERVSRADALEVCDWRYAPARFRLLVLPTLTRLKRAGSERVACMGS